MICLDCINLDLQTYPKHSATGFAKCKFEPVGQFVNITRERTCAKFEKAPVDVVAKRTEWANKTFGTGK